MQKQILQLVCPGSCYISKRRFSKYFRDYQRYFLQIFFKILGLNLKDHQYDSISWIKFVLYFSPHIASWFFFCYYFLLFSFCYFYFYSFIYLFIYLLYCKIFHFLGVRFCVKLQKIQIIDDFNFLMGSVLQSFFNFCPRNKFHLR